MNESASAVAPGFRFGILDLLWTTFAAGLALGYLRTLETPENLPVLVIVLSLAALMGATIGSFTGQRTDGVYWSVMIAAAAFLAVIPDPRNSLPFIYAWSVTGAAIGSWAGALPRGSLGLKLLMAAGSALLVMLSFSGILVASPIELMFDLICAPLVAGASVLLIEFVLWFERTRGFPRYAVASWLLSATILGNLVVKLVLN